MKEGLRIAREEIRKVNRELAEEQFKWNKLKVTVKLDSLRHIKHKNYKRDKFDVFVGDNNYRIEIDNIGIPEIPFPDADSISAHIERVMKSVNVYTTSSPKNPTRLSKRYNFQYGFRDSLNKVDVSPKIMVSPLPELDSIMNFNFNYYNKNQEIDSLVSLYMPKFKFRQDSLTNYFRMYDDSARYLYETEIQNQLEDIEVEMKKFREEMQKLREDLNKDSSNKRNSKTIKKPVEI